MRFVIKDVDNDMFLSKSDLLSGQGWCWCELIVDDYPETAPYIFSNADEAGSVLLRYASVGNCIVKEITL